MRDSNDEFKEGISKVIVDGNSAFQTNLTTAVETLKIAISEYSHVFEKAAAAADEMTIAANKVSRK
jgi:hypothetical protein